MENFDPATNFFRIRGLTLTKLSRSLEQPFRGLSDDLIETALRLDSLEEWTPFAAEDRAVYQDIAAKTGRGLSILCYRTTITRVLSRGSGLSRLGTSKRMVHTSSVKMFAERMIPGMASRFRDQHIGRLIAEFSQSPTNTKSLLNPKISAASVSKFPAFELDRRKFCCHPIHYWPHPDALAWHKEEIFDRFSP